MALHLTSCHRVSDIPRTVFADLARRIDRQEILCGRYCEGENGDIFLDEEITDQERLAVIEALQERAS